MQFTTLQTTKFQILGVLTSFLMLSSCGSFQYVGYDNDGIYNSEEVTVDVERASNSREGSEFYSNYFSLESQQMQDISEENEIFTDVDSYNSGNAVNQQVQEIPGNNAGWGQVNDQIVVNIHNNGWNNWGWGFQDPWLFNGGFGWNNWGWNGFGWNRWNRWNRWGGQGFGLCWNNWGWNQGFGWNGGFGWNNLGWNNGFHGNNNLAFNNGRRGATYGRSNTGITRRGNSVLNSRSIAQLDRRTITRRNQSTSRLGVNNNRSREGNIENTRVRRNTDGSIMRPRTSSNRVRNSNGTLVRPRTSSNRVRTNNGTRTSRPRVTRPSTRSNSSGNSVRRSSSSRSSGSVRSSSRSSSSRSSGSVRSSSSSSRSSGGSRSSGSSRGSRGRG